MTEDQARTVVLLQAIESAEAGELWTADDRQWATRAALQQLPADAGRLPFVVERARLAMQRLAPRDAALARALALRGWSPAWPWAALAAGIVLGLLSDALVAGPYFNLLSPLLWGLLAWNLALYLLIGAAALRRARPGPLRQALARSAQRGLRRLAGDGPMAGFAALWAKASLPLANARFGGLLHLLAAGLALGLIGGLMLRGLVFDYRAGWASTLLQPETLRGLLASGLAPAHALTGIEAPDAATFAALQVMPGQPAQASAAPWIWLLGSQLALLVLLPRLALAAASAWRARRLAAHFPLHLGGRYFEQQPPLAAPQSVWVLPHAQAPDPQALEGLRALLHEVWGAAPTLRVAPPVPYGDEASPPAPPAGARVLVLADLAATPEPDTQGRLLRSLTPADGPPPLLLVDDSVFVSRFGHGARRNERLAAWLALARSCGAPMTVATLEAPDPKAAAAALRRALDGA